jgi:Uncharacterised nucleotidyltransferase
MDGAALYQFIERLWGAPAQRELDAAAVKVLDAFDAAGVKAILLKGPALARFLYWPDEPRSYSDVDVLVPPDGLAPARGALAKLGYSDASAANAFGVDDVAGVVHAELWSRQGERGPVLIDLHWALPGWEAPAGVIWDALGKRRTWIELAGRQVPVFDRAALALHLATHAGQHGPEDGKALTDLARGIRRWPLDVWRSAADLANEVKAGSLFAAGLRLLPEGAALATDLGLPSTDELDWKIRHRGTRPRGTFHLDAFMEARGVRERANVLGRSLIPRSRWIARRYPWAASGGMRLLAGYAAHLLSSPAWAVRAWRFRRGARRASY